MAVEAATNIETGEMNAAGPGARNCGRCDGEMKTPLKPITKSSTPTNSRFRLLFLAECVRTAGSELSLVAVSIAVIQTGGSAVDVGIVLMARSIPPIAVLLFAGSLIDRFPRGRLMLYASILSMIAQLALSVVFLSGAVNLLVIAIFQAILGAFTALFRPTTVGLIPQIVSPGQLQSANSSIALANNVASIVGPASAGMLLLVLPAATLILFDAITFALAAILVVPLWGVRAKRSTEREKYWAEFAAGWAHLRATRWLWVTILQAMLFQTGFAMFFVLGPILSSEEANGSSLWAIVVTSFGIGAVLGSIIANWYRPRVPVISMQVVLAFCLPLFALLALPLSFLSAIPTALLAGASLSLAGTLGGTFLQRATPDHLLGRVASITSLSSASLRPMGYLSAGLIAASLGASETFAVIGGLLLVSILVTFAMLRPDRDLLVDHSRVERSWVDAE